MPKSKPTDLATAAELQQQLLGAGALATAYGAWAVNKMAPKRALGWSPQTPRQMQTRASGSRTRPRARQNWLRLGFKTRIMNRWNKLRARMRRGASKAPKFPVGPYQGRFKKQRRVKPTKVTGNKEAVYGTITGENATYGGFFKCGGRRRLIREFAEKLVTTIIRERKVTCPSRDSTIFWQGDRWYDSSIAGGTAPTQMVFLFNEKDKDGNNYGTQFAQNLVPSQTNGTYYYTYDELVTELVPKFEAHLNNDERHIVGYKLNCIWGDSTSVIYERSLAEWKLTMTVRCNLKIQNITPADIGGEQEKYDKDNIANNPLTGRIMTFSGGVPRIRGQFAGSINGAPYIADTDDHEGLLVFPAGSNSIYDNGNALHVVPKGTTLFENCTHSTPVSLSPGGHKNISTLYTFSGTLKQFTKKLNTSFAFPFKCGETVCFGFEPAMRTNENEVVKLAYHLDVVSHSTLWPRHRIYVEQRNKTVVRNLG